MPDSPPSLRQHFAALAPQYRQLRDLDVRAVRRVAGILRAALAPRSGPRLLEVGTGTGRYTQAVLHQLASEGTARPRVAAVDAMREMLGAFAARFPPDVATVQRVLALAEDLPFAADTFDAVLSFNAVHYFDLAAFLREAARVTRAAGRLLLYTRTPEQNRRTVWGQFFPEFAARETRLHSERTLQAALAATKCFRSVRLIPLPWVVRTGLPRLLEQAYRRYYSTFEFYTRREFTAAVAKFERRVREYYRDPAAITARSDHLLVHAIRR